MVHIGCNQFLLVTGIGFGLLSVLSCGPATADPLPCREAVHEGSRYTVCEVDLRRQIVKLFWKKSDGEPYRYLNSVPRTLGEGSGRLLFATNAGMFDPDYNPVGLYIENGDNSYLERCSEADERRIARQCSRPSGLRCHGSRIGSGKRAFSIQRGGGQGHHTDSPGFDDNDDCAAPGAI
jgi:hypothetical protein